MKAPTPAALPVPTCECPQIPVGKIKVDGVLSEPVWQKAAPAGPFTLWDGKPAAWRTTARLLWDPKNLYVAFTCDDTDIESTMRRHDQNLWEQNEVVELFADAGGEQTCYLEFEVNPRNAVVDLVLPSADSPGPLAGKKCWDAKGMKTAVRVRGSIGNRKDKDKGWTVEMAIPLQDFLTAPNCPPKNGDTWRVNLYRVDDTQGEVEFQAWSPTNTEKPSFHVPQRFGVLRFVAKEPAGGAPQRPPRGAAKAGGLTPAPAGKAGGTAATVGGTERTTSGAPRATRTKMGTPPAGKGG